METQLAPSLWLGQVGSWWDRWGKPEAGWGGKRAFFRHGRIKVKAGMAERPPPAASLIYRPHTVVGMVEGWQRLRPENQRKQRPGLQLYSPPSPLDSLCLSKNRGTWNISPDMSNLSEESGSWEMESKRPLVECSAGFSRTRMGLEKEVNDLRAMFAALSPPNPTPPDPGGSGENPDTKTFITLKIYQQQRLPFV